ncbi:hypothetical protein [Streptomyces sp. NPDC055134]
MGVDIAVTPADAPDRPGQRRRPPARGSAHVIEARWRVTLLKPGQAGTANKLRAITLTAT